MNVYRALRRLAAMSLLALLISAFAFPLSAAHAQSLLDPIKETTKKVDDTVTDVVDTVEEVADDPVDVIEDETKPITDTVGSVVDPAPKPPPSQPPPPPPATCETDPARCDNEKVEPPRRHDGAKVRGTAVSATRSKRNDRDRIDRRNGAASGFRPGRTEAFDPAAGFVPDDARASDALVNNLGDTLKTFSFPLVLTLLVVAFLVMQSRVDGRDPKLALAPVTSENDYLSFS